MEPLKLTVIHGALAGEPAGDYIEDVFGEGGFLAGKVPGYKPRPGQIKLARAIDRAIREGRHVIGEGPTGTGKSLAYSVPAVFHAVFNGKKVCVVTANKNLQRQIYAKDLVDLEKAVPWKFTYAIRKGHSSYLCLRNVENEEWRDLLFDKPSLSEKVEETAEWAKETATGDFEDSPGPPPAVWSAFSTSREDCDGRKCEYFEECYVKQAREKALGADVTVTNYHLFFLHLKMGAESKILPHFDIVILDEAHRAANTARNFFGVEITFNNIYRCLTNMHMVEMRGFKERGARLREEILAEANRVWDGLGQRARARRAVFNEKSTLDSERLEELLAKGAAFYIEVRDALTSGNGPMQQIEMFKKAPTAARNNADAKAYEKLADKCAERAIQLSDFRTVAGEGMVYFIEGSGVGEKAKYVKLKSKAVEVAGIMRGALFERYKTVVQTSATLAVRGGTGSDFAYLKREMGMGEMKDREPLSVEELVVDSPFNWPKQAMLVIPRSMPTFVTGSKDQEGADRWDAAVLDHLERTVNFARGRTLALFTSFRMLEKARDHLRATTRWRILVQGEGTNRELAERFQSDTDSVLLGTESFSEGVSIEGEACSCVVLDKIPFINGDDPVLLALAERARKRGNRAGVFASHMLPEAIISFKQRVGRLIRTVTDRGVVVCLDKRLLTQAYRTQFIKSIPPIRLEESVDAIGPFFNRVQ